MYQKSNVNNIKSIVVRILIIGIPSYSVAVFTEIVICVVPTVAMMMMTVNSVEFGNYTSRNRIDTEESVIDDEATQKSLEGSGWVQLDGRSNCETKVSFFKVLSIFLPIFSAAYFTQDMVYVLLPLAIGIFAGSSLKQNDAEEGNKAEFESSDKTKVMKLCGQFFPKIY